MDGQYDGPVEDHYHTHGLKPPAGGHHHHHRPRSPGLQWHNKYSPEGLKRGRVLMIDYVKKDHTKEGMRKVAAEEISSLDGLRKVYSNPDRDREAVLRVFHVQNAYWATRFLLRKFNIDNRDNLVGTDFGNWVRHKRPERRAGRPVLNGKTWRTQHDPWRGISRTAFGIDYLKQYKMRSSAETNSAEDEAVKMMELNCPFTDENPSEGYNVFVQRLAVYIQHKDDSPAIPNDPDILNPYNEAEYFRRRGIQHENVYIPVLDSLDNGNTIIIFENSHSGSIEDTMIAARNKWESRWRRLPFYLAFESKDIPDDDHMAVECMRMILGDIFKCIVEVWDSLLDACWDHVSILEDKIYEQPADESRAPELWTNSSQWLKVEKLMMVHVDILKELRLHLSELSDDDETESSWLDTSPGDFERLTNLIQEDLIKPTTNLADLMYKSVGIRDSRQSLQLGTSMWRLSWITFIFLPLTFMVGFFGMNVDTFAGDPSIKWYFIVAVPFMILILVFWFITKHLLARRRQTPYQRGIHEQFFHDLATAYPSLWTRSGPRDFVAPAGFLHRLKWRIVTAWADPGKTIRIESDGGDDGLGSWSRFKRYLIRKWSAEIRTANLVRPAGALDSLLEQGGDTPADDGGMNTDVLANGIGAATELLVLSGAAPSNVTGDNLPAGFLKIPSSRPTSRTEGTRPVSSAGSTGSGIMVEEKEPGWLRTDFRPKEGAGKGEERKKGGDVRKQDGQRGRESEPEGKRAARNLGADVRSSVEERSRELRMARRSEEATRASSRRSRRREAEDEVVAEHKDDSHALGGADSDTGAGGK
ncbi:MAG: hypothetical protein M1837_006233 [Sclerophora amabilis]|nr:MAG: hypothetical protein M1837_006233 [Sclerophora amabilis]